VLFGEFTPQLRDGPMLKVTFPGTERAAHEAASAVIELLDELHPTDRRRDEVRTAVVEAFRNAWRHGNGGRSDLLVRVKAQISGDSIEVEISDAGSGLAEVPPTPDLAHKVAGDERPTGWGLFLMRSFSSEVTFVARAEGGCSVRMRFGRLAPADPADVRIRGPADR
jgi:anti-sigma regulatory factor (Ser/Thr protein kinase)